MAVISEDILYFQRNINFLICGGIAGITSSYINFSIGKNKSSFQTNNSLFANKSFISCFKYMHKNEGIMVFFKGNSANVIRVVPFSALEFFTFDFIRYRILLGESLSTRRSLIIGAIAGLVSTTLVKNKKYILLKIYD